MNVALRPLAPHDTGTLAEIWNRACEELTVSPRMFDYLMQAPREVLLAGRLVCGGEQAAGFILTSLVPACPRIARPELGWIEALAVVPEFRHDGLGARLLSWAETWLKAKGARQAALGGGIRPLLPGLPAELQNHVFFRQRGYHNGSETVWDLARDLSDYAKAEPPARPPDMRCDPAQPERLDELCRFLEREFPGRWHFEFLEFIRQGGRPQDYMLLQQGSRIQGFARMTLADSERPLDRFFMHRLPRPWAQVGPIGISASCRGRGYGRALVDAVLVHLHRRGIRGCVIDWTTQTDFYRRFGFRPYRGYLLLSKQLD